MPVNCLIVEEVKHVPPVNLMQEGVLYYSKEFSTAIHLCACGCKGQVVTPISDGISYGWQYSEGPTLSPSIGNQHWPCHSHYFVTNGKIVHCSDHGVSS